MKKKVIVASLFMIFVLFFSVVLSGCSEQFGQALQMRVKSFRGCKTNVESSCTDGKQVTIEYRRDCTTYVHPEVTCTYGCSDDGKSCRVQWVPGSPPRCGNSVKEASEECDGGVCANGLACTAGCTCPTHVCGNGVIEGPEQCDGGVCAGGASCTASCTCPAALAAPIYVVASSTAVCGNGRIDGSEQCDGGVCANGLACAADCTCPTTTPPPAAATTTVDCVTTYGTGFKCISRGTLAAETSTCTASGGHLESHCAGGDPLCALQLISETAITPAKDVGPIITVPPTLTPPRLTGDAISTETTTAEVVETSSLLPPDRCCVKCVMPPTFTVVTPTPIFIIPLGRAVMDTGLVECSSFGKGYFCVATETEFQDECKGNGEMYPSASCLTESEAEGFCVIC